MAEASKILYSKPFQPSKIIKKDSLKSSNLKTVDEEENAPPPPSKIYKQKNKTFPVEKEVLEKKKD